MDEMRWASKKPMRVGKGFYGVSASSFDLPSADAVAKRSANVPHDYFSASTARQLRAAGVAVVLDDERTPGHVSLRFPAKPGNPQVRALADAFGAPRPNPRPGKKRR